MRGLVPALILLLLLFPTDGYASSSESLWSRGETALWAGTLVAAGGLTLVDEDIRTFFQKNRGEPADSVADALDILGHPLSTLVFGGGLHLYGRASDDPHAAETGEIALHAVLGSQVAVFILKSAVGRERPDVSGDAHAFDPITLRRDNNSFPSGHAAASFALASVLAQRSLSPWAPYAYYGLAGAVGVSRLVRDDHWASDVLVGAIIGETAARIAIRWNERKGEAEPWSVGLVPVHGGGLVAVTARW